jgi:hypothetical protein
MNGRRRRPWRHVVAGFLGVLLGVALGIPVGHAAPRFPTPRAGGDWTVEPVAGGFKVTLRLAERVPMRDALPWLAVDGRPTGPAREAADRRTFTVVTTDPRVLRATGVELVWSPHGSPESSRRARPAQPDRTWLRPTGRPLDVDPGSTGRFPVARAEYDLGDEAVRLSGLGHRAELRAAVYTPRGATGPRPIVLFLHGRHDFCYGEWPQDGAVDPWPCPPGTQPVPSYRGYAAPAAALASHGYHVVSISANAVNAWDFDTVDGGALARAQLMLAHLDLWRRWSTAGGGPFGRRFAGRVDLHHVGLMGHSRGGEGVVRAALLNAARPRPYGIRAVLPVAPTDFSRPTIPGVAMSVLLPYCDGDVWDLQGQHLFDDTRYAVTGDQAPRSAVLVLGANHNYFNTEWTPGQAAAPAWDDWFGEPTEECGSDHPGRLSAREQQAVGRAYVAGFFRLMLGRETALLPLLDGSGARAASAGRAVVRVTAHGPAAARRDAARFDRPLPAGGVTGAATTRVCAGVTVRVPEAAATAALAQQRTTTVPPLTCRTVDDPAQAPHWTPAYLAPRSPTTTVTRLTWTGRTGRVRLALPAQQRDLRRFAALTMRAAPDPSVPGRPDLTVRVVDGRGRAADVTVSAVSDALTALPGTTAPLGKTVLRTVRIPLSRLGRVDLRDIRAVELHTNRAPNGSVFLADLAAVRPSLGRSGPSPLPRLSVADLRMPEGDTGRRFARFTITVSRRSRVPISVHAETVGVEVGNVGSVSRRLVIPAGRTTATVLVPVHPNTADSYDVHFLLVLSVPHQALVNRSIGTGVVLDDDPTPTIVVGAGAAAEGDGLLSFPIRLSAPSDKGVVVFGELEDGTARLGSDFRSEHDDGEGDPERTAIGIVEPGAGVEGSMPVVILDDGIPEGDETFSVRIIEVSEATLTGPPVALGTITDDD